MKKAIGSFKVLWSLLLVLLLSSACGYGSYHTIEQDVIPYVTQEPTRLTAENGTDSATQAETAATEKEEVTEPETAAFVWHEFASKKLYDQHYEKHVITQQEYGDISQQEYLQQANELFNASGDHILTKTEEDGDTLYYNTETNDFGVLRPDGVIRTFFKPSAGIDYFNRQ